MCRGYSLDAPCWGTSNKYPQHMFLSRNKKKCSYFLVEKSTLSKAMCYFVDKSLFFFYFYTEKYVHLETENESCYIAVCWSY